MTRFLMMVCVACCVASTGTASGAELRLRALGAPEAATRISETPTPDSPVTLLRVLREVWPDLAPDGRAGRFNGARVVPGAVDPDAGKPGAWDMDFARSGDAPTYAVLADGNRRYVAIAIASMLLLARIAPDYRFLDAIFVQTDPGGVPALTHTLMLAPDYPGVVVLNSHHNSQEGFANYLVLALVDGRLASVYDGPFLYSFSIAQGKCEPLTVTQTLSALDMMANKGSHPADLALRVREERVCVSAGKQGKPVERLHAFRLAWDAKRKRYLGGSKELYLTNRKRVGN